MASTKDPSPRYPSSGKNLVSVQLCNWPPQQGSPTQKLRMLKLILADLRHCLDPLKPTPVPPRPKGARKAMAAGSESLPAGPNCWLASSTIRGCLVNGQEMVCRVDHYECDDGSWYDVETPLGAAGTAGHEEAIA